MNKSVRQKILDEQITESARLVKERLQHEATRDEMLAAYSELDEQCIRLAARFNSEALAGSPRALVTQVELKAKRWARDNVKHQWVRTRDALANSNHGLTEPHIQTFNQYCLDLANATLGLRHVTVENVIPRVDGTRTYVVKHNLDRLTQKREAIMAALNEVRALRDEPLSELLATIEKRKSALDEIDTEEVEGAELNEMQYGDMVARDEPKKGGSGILLPNGEVAIIGESESARLGRRLDKLANDPFFRRT